MFQTNLFHLSLCSKPLSLSLCRYDLSFVFCSESFCLLAGHNISQLMIFLYAGDSSLSAITEPSYTLAIFTMGTFKWTDSPIVLL